MIGEPTIKAMPWNMAMRPKALVNRSRPSSSTRMMGLSDVHAPVKEVNTGLLNDPDEPSPDQLRCNKDYL